jgi:hypothetical protein
VAAESSMILIGAAGLARAQDPKRRVYHRLHSIPDLTIGVSSEYNPA